MTYYHNHDSSAEDRLVREYQVSTTACRQLANWALAHFGERTDPTAYTRIVVSLATQGPDYAVDKIYKDLHKLGFTYRNEAVWRMYERFRMDAERQYPISRTIAA
ncbi:ATPase inhibitor subunit zeta [Ponticaulis profundi]|uniref:ATPase inhibitor subunit zeta n=1 Tax=Ponticaulis profundi TaxID=2665222 RepID=A0ABW1S791_9PROT